MTVTGTGRGRGTGDGDGDGDAYVMAYIMAICAWLYGAWLYVHGYMRMAIGEWL